MYRDGLTGTAQVEHAQRNLLYLLHYCYDIPIYESEIAHMQSRMANWFEILTFMFTGLELSTMLRVVYACIKTVSWLTSKKSI
ncbi:MAG: hypothetical protein AWU59_735 [Methanolobus sp. T82-4]|nr:MAG: hypothetical protein AWU59_735 [Methanolobus sp. T82-4]